MFAGRGAPGNATVNTPLQSSFGSNISDCQATSGSTARADTSNAVGFGIVGRGFGNKIVSAGDSIIIVVKAGARIGTAISIGTAPP